MCARVPKLDNYQDFGATHCSFAHMAVLEPTIKHLLHTAQLPFSLQAGDPDIIQEFPVNVREFAACGQQVKNAGGNETKTNGDRKQNSKGRSSGPS